MPVRRRLVTLLVTVLVAALSLAACSAGRTATPSPAPTPAPTPTLAVNLPNDLCANTGADCDVSAGAYEAQQFEPRVAFTLDDGWTNVAYVERAIQLVRGGVDTPTESLSIVSGQLDGPNGESAAAGAVSADFLTYLHKLSGVTVTDQAAVLLGGLPAAQVDVKVGKANVTLFNQPLQTGTEDPYDLRAGEILRLDVVDVGTARVVFIIEVFGTAKLADFEKMEIQPLLASLTFPAT